MPKHAKRITEGEFFEIMETGRENFNNNKVLDGFMYCDSTEYSSTILPSSMNKENRNY